MKLRLVGGRLWVRLERGDPMMCKLKNGSWFVHEYNGEPRNACVRPSGNRSDFSRANLQRLAQQLQVDSSFLLDAWDRQVTGRQPSHDLE